MVLRYTYTYIYHYYNLDIPGPTRESFVRRALGDQCRLGLELNPASVRCLRRLWTISLSGFFRLNLGNDSQSVNFCITASLSIMFFLFSSNVFFASICFDSTRLLLSTQYSVTCTTYVI